MRESLLVFMLLLWKQERAWSIRLVELRVPGHAAAGSEALLGCQYDTTGDVLYSVKWYKDGREFYRYVPGNKYPALNFATPGVYVDMSRSSSEVVTLVNLERESAGLYRCEVSGEAPLFTTLADEKHITIHVLPESGPKVTGLHHAYRTGDRIVANCTSGPSKPEAQLKWVLNGKSVRRDHLKGPWYRVAEPDTAEVSLQLHFKVTPVHFRRGLMEIKCQATIAPLYQQEILYRISEIPDLPIPTLSAEDEVFETTTIQYNYDTNEDVNLRLNALYEIRRRLYGRLDVNTTSSKSPLDTESTRKPVEKEQERSIETPFTTQSQSMFFNNEQDPPNLPPNSGTLMHGSTLVILVALLNSLWHGL